MSRHVHVDLPSGASGDMLLGALVDAGVDLAELEAGLRTLPLSGWELRRSERRDPRVGGVKIDVWVEGRVADGRPQDHEHGHDHDHGHAHDHDHAFDRGHEVDATPAHDHGGEHAHAHGGHAHDHGEHTHRRLGDVLAILGGSSLPEPVLAKAERAFRLLAEAEGTVHGHPADEVHFHEVGDVDAIVDVCGVLYGLHLLGVDSVSVGPIPLGSGTVWCQHGRIPVPVPATLELIRGLPTVPAPGQHPTGELVTPTGAAILRAVADAFGPPPAMTLEQVAIGLGTRERADLPNAVRLLVGARDGEQQDVEVITATLDDLDPRVLGALTPRLLELGALDVVLRPVQGKKGRPATQLEVLSPPDATRDALVEAIFAETTTLGLRIRTEQRITLQRRFDRVSTPFGSIVIKEGSRNGSVVTLQPEFDSAQAAAELHDVPVRVVLDAARQAAAARDE